MALLVGGSSYSSLPNPSGRDVWWVKRKTPGTVTANWIDPDGLIYNLTSIWHQGPGYFTMDGPAAWGATPIELVTDPYPRGGEVVRFIRAQPRRIQWPLYVGGDSHMDFVDNYREIMRAFTKTTYRRAPGTLELKRPDGTARRISAFYEQGFEGEAGENWLWAKPVIQLFCPDGYFYQREPVTFAGDVQMSDPNDIEQKNFFAPFITLTASPVFSGDDPAPTMINHGDVEAWPVWTLTGPMKGFEATNLTTGMRFAFTGAIDSGVTVTINSNPVSVRSSAGLNLSRYIDWFNTAGTTLWSFAPGTNDVQIDLDGPQDGAGVEVAFQPRFESA